MPAVSPPHIQAASLCAVWVGLVANTEDGLNCEVQTAQRGILGVNNTYREGPNDKGVHSSNLGEVLFIFINKY